MCSMVVCILDGVQVPYNRLFLKIRNCHSNIRSAILNGATMLAIVW